MAALFASHGIRGGFVEVVEDRTRSGVDTSRPVERIEPSMDVGPGRPVCGRSQVLIQILPSADKLLPNRTSKENSTCLEVSSFPFSFSMYSE